MQAKCCGGRILCAILAVVIVLSSSGGCSASIGAYAEARGALFINEVVSSNSFSFVDPVLGTPDWIELYNAGDKDIDLTGFVLSNDKNKPRFFTFPAVTIKAGQYMLVYCASKPSGASADVICTGFNLPKTGVTLQLTDKRGAVVHTLDVPALNTDIAWARDKDGEFKYFAFPTPGQANAGAASNDIDELDIEPESPLRINEVSPNNANALTDEDGSPSDWVEIYNSGKTAVSLNNYWLSEETLNPTKWRFPDVELGPGQYIVVYLSGKNRTDAGANLHTSFKLSESETVLVLSDVRGTVVDLLEWDANILQDMTVGYAGDEIKYFLTPTPGAANPDEGLDSISLSPMTEQDPVHINEILVNNAYSIIDADGDRPGFVELKNTSDSDVSLLGYALSDNPENTGKWLLPEVTIPAGGYLVVFLSGKDRREGELHASFRLGKSDIALILTDMKNMRSETINVPADTRDDISYGNSPDGKWLYFPTPTPGAPNGTYGFESIAQTPEINAEGLYISEVRAVSAAKSGGLDWVEIANGGSRAVNLRGYYLSDDTDNPKKWKIDADISVPAGGYAVIYADSETDKKDVAPFSIALSGERIMLSSPQGFALDVFETGVLNENITSGRAAGDASGTRFFFLSATPGKENSSPKVDSYTATPVFSVPGGFVSGKISVEISCSTAGAVIYYTTDGSKPTTSSKRYTSPIEISSNTPLRAMAVASGKLPSEVKSATYLFEKKHTVPVVCISGKPSDISELYAVVDKTVSIEREGYIEYFEADGRLGISFPAGVRVAGAGSRIAPQKSLNLYLRGAYGRSNVTYPFFEDFDLTYFRALTLRNSGNDRADARMRDVFCHMAAKGMNVDYAEYRLVAVYINGRYWGLYDLRENQNEPYFATHYGISEDNVEIIRRNQTALSGTKYEILKVRGYAVSWNMADDDTFARFCEYVDADAFMEYIIAESYFCNSDMFNQKFWRAKDYSVKWRPVYFDMDFGTRNNPSSSILDDFFNPLGVPSANGSLTNMDIQCALVKNAGWREKFIERYAYHINNTFAAERLLPIFEKITKEMEPEMERHIRRWGNPSSVSEWKSEIKVVRDYIIKRPKLAAENLRRHFGISNARMHELFPQWY